jgi:hypothetical protein
MRNQWLMRLVTAILLAGWLLAACGPASPTAPPPTPTPSPVGTAAVSAATQGRCGDGICDEAERADLNLCPQDCQLMGATPTATPAPTEVVAKPPTPTPTSTPTLSPTLTLTPPPVVKSGEGAGCVSGEWWLEVAGCADYHGNVEPSARICSSFEVCLTVDEDCHIHGSTTGRYDQETCVFTSPLGCMSYELTCPDFPVSVSGKLVTDTLWVFVDASQIFEEEVKATEICVTGLTQGPYSFGAMQGGYGSATRNGGGYLCKIQARDGWHVEVAGVDAVAPEHLSYSFTCDLYAPCLVHPVPTATGPVPPMPPATTPRPGLSPTPSPTP